MVIGEVVSVSPWLCNPLKRRCSSLVLKQEPRKHFIHKWCVETEKLSCISWPQIEFYSGSTWWTTDQSHASFFNICWHLLVLASILPSFFFFLNHSPQDRDHAKPVTPLSPTIVIHAHLMNFFPCVDYWWPLLILRNTFSILTAVYCPNSVLFKLEPAPKSPGAYVKTNSWAPPRSFWPSRSGVVSEFLTFWHSQVMLMVGDPALRPQLNHNEVVGYDENLFGIVRKALPVEWTVLSSTRLILSFREWIANWMIMSFGFLNCSFICMHV